MDDARVLELSWLTELERNGGKVIGPLTPDSREHRLAIHLLAEGFVQPRFGSNIDVYTNLQHLLENQRWDAVRDIFLGTQVPLVITHAGAVRRAELEQQLQTGRIKEPMGLIWDGRHFRRDTRIALLDVARERPLVVVYLDLNDMKVFNNKGHATGDAAIQRYLELVADIAADRGDAYRLSGGADEVVILLPLLDLERGLQTVRSLLSALGRERVDGYSLRAAAGVVVVTDAENADELKERADREQACAKAASRSIDGHPSVLASPAGIEIIPLPVPKTIMEQLADARLLIETAADPSSVADVLDTGPFEEWKPFLEHALREKPVEAERLLRWVAQSHSDSGWRFNAIMILDDLMDDEFLRNLLGREQDAETRELLLELGARGSGARR
jgi:GGDEF domain-containing protein